MKTKAMNLLLKLAGAAALALACLVFVPDTVQAQTVIYACYVPSSGVVYRIGEPGLRQECSGKKHVEFSWNEEGLEGPPGPAGPLGQLQITQRTLQSTLTPAGEPGSGKALSVPCASGEVVTGGGWFTPQLDVILTNGSRPFSTGEGWSVTFANTASTIRDVTAYAMCGKIIP